MKKEIKITCQGAATLPLDGLIEFQGDLKNLSKENYQKLKKEILELGFSEPISVWRESSKGMSGKRVTNHILNGHQRTRTLRQMRDEGYEIPELPVNFIEAKDEKEAKRKVLALTSQYGEITHQGLYEFMHEAEIDFKEIENSFRFPEIDFEKFEAEFFTETESAGDEDEIPPAPVEPKTRAGDLYILGNHRLLCGDSTKKEDVERLMNGEKADMVFTDPPYGMSYQSNAWDSKSLDVQKKKTNKHIEGDRSTEIGVTSLPVISSFLAEKAHSYVWCRWDCFPDFLNASQCLGKHKGVIVWDKGGPGLGDLECSYGDSEWAVHILKGRKPLAERQNCVWQVNRMKGLQMSHPTQKPVELAERAILNSTAIKEMIVDIFLGSGSTLIACEKTNRRCFGMEIDPAYCDVIVSRWEKFTGKKAELWTSN